MDTLSNIGNAMIAGIFGMPFGGSNAAPSSQSPAKEVTPSMLRSAAARLLLIDNVHPALQQTLQGQLGSGSLEALTGELQPLQLCAFWDGAPHDSGDPVQDQLLNYLAVVYGRLIEQSRSLALLEGGVALERIRALQASLGMRNEPQAQVQARLAAIEGRLREIAQSDQAAMDALLEHNKALSVGELALPLHLLLPRLSHALLTYLPSTALFRLVTALPGLYRDPPTLQKAKDAVQGVIAAPSVSEGLARLNGLLEQGVLTPLAALSALGALAAAPLSAPLALVLAGVVCGVHDGLVDKLLQKVGVPEAELAKVLVQTNRLSGNGQALWSQLSSLTSPLRDRVWAMLGPGVSIDEGVAYRDAIDHISEQLRTSSEGSAEEIAPLLAREYQTLEGLKQSAGMADDAGSRQIIAQEQARLAAGVLLLGAFAEAPGTLQERLGALEDLRDRLGSSGVPANVAGWIGHDVNGQADAGRASAATSGAASSLPGWLLACLPAWLAGKEVANLLPRTAPDASIKHAQELVHMLPPAGTAAVGAVHGAARMVQQGLGGFATRHPGSVIAAGVTAGAAVGYAGYRAATAVAGYVWPAAAQSTTVNQDDDIQPNACRDIDTELLGQSLTGLNAQQCSHLFKAIEIELGQSVGGSVLPQTLWKQIDTMDRLNNGSDDAHLLAQVGQLLLQPDRIQSSHSYAQVLQQLFDEEQALAAAQQQQEVGTTPPASRSKRHAVRSEAGVGVDTELPAKLALGSVRRARAIEESSGALRDRINKISELSWRQMSISLDATAAELLDQQFDYVDSHYLSSPDERALDMISAQDIARIGSSYMHTPPFAAGSAPMDDDQALRMAALCELSKTTSIAEQVITAFEDGSAELDADTLDKLQQVTDWAERLGSQYPRKFAAPTWRETALILLPQTHTQRVGALAQARPQLGFLQNWRDTGNTFSLASPPQANQAVRLQLGLMGDPWPATEEYLFLHLDPAQRTSPQWRRYAAYGFNHLDDRVRIGRFNPHTQRLELQVRPGQNRIYLRSDDSRSARMSIETVATPTPIQATSLTVTSMPLDSLQQQATQPILLLQAPVQSTVPANLGVQATQQLTASWQEVLQLGLAVPLPSEVIGNDLAKRFGQVFPGLADNIQGVALTVRTLKEEPIPVAERGADGQMFRKTVTGEYRLTDLAWQAAAGGSPANDHFGILGNVEIVLVTDNGIEVPAVLNTQEAKVKVKTLLMDTTASSTHLLLERAMSDFWGKPSAVSGLRTNKDWLALQWGAQLRAQAKVLAAYGLRSTDGGVLSAEGRKVAEAALDAPDAPSRAKLPVNARPGVWVLTGTQPESAQDGSGSLVLSEHDDKDAMGRVVLWSMGATLREFDAYSALETYLRQSGEVLGEVTPIAVAENFPVRQVSGLIAHQKQQMQDTWRLGSAQVRAGIPAQLLAQALDQVSDIQALLALGHSTAEAVDFFEYQQLWSAYPQLAWLSDQGITEQKQWLDYSNAARLFWQVFNRELPSQQTLWSQRTAAYWKAQGLPGDPAHYTVKLNGIASAGTLKVPYTRSDSLQQASMVLPGLSGATPEVLHAGKAVTAAQQQSVMAFLRGPGAWSPLLKEVANSLKAQRPQLLPHYTAFLKTELLRDVLEARFKGELGKGGDYLPGEAIVLAAMRNDPTVKVGVLTLSTVSSQKDPTLDMPRTGQPREKRPTPIDTGAQNVSVTLSNWWVFERQGDNAGVVLYRPEDNLWQQYQSTQELYQDLDQIRLQTRLLNEARPGNATVSLSREALARAQAKDRPALLKFFHDINQKPTLWKPDNLKFDAYQPADFAQLITQWAGQRLDVLEKELGWAVQESQDRGLVTAQAQWQVLTTQLDAFKQQHLPTLHAFTGIQESRKLSDYLHQRNLDRYASNPLGAKPTDVLAPRKLPSREQVDTDAIFIRYTDHSVVSKPHTVNQTLTNWVGEGYRKLDPGPDFQKNMQIYTADPKLQTTLEQPEVKAWLERNMRSTYSGSDYIASVKKLLDPADPRFASYQQLRVLQQVLELRLAVAKANVANELGHDASWLAALVNGLPGSIVTSTGEEIGELSIAGKRIPGVWVLSRPYTVATRTPTAALKRDSYVFMPGAPLGKSLWRLDQTFLGLLRTEPFRRIIEQRMLVRDHHHINEAFASYSPDSFRQSVQRIDSFTAACDQQLRDILDNTDENTVSRAEVIEELVVKAGRGALAGACILASVPTGGVATVACAAGTLGLFGYDLANVVDLIERNQMGEALLETAFLVLDAADVGGVLGDASRIALQRAFKAVDIFQLAQRGTSAAQQGGSAAAQSAVDALRRSTAELAQLVGKNSLDSIEEVLEAASTVVGWSKAVSEDGGLGARFARAELNPSDLVRNTNPPGIGHKGEFYKRAGSDEDYIIDNGNVFQVKSAGGGRRLELVDPQRPHGPGMPVAQRQGRWQYDDGGLKGGGKVLSRNSRPPMESAAVPVYSDSEQFIENLLKQKKAVPTTHEIVIDSVEKLRALNFPVPPRVYRAHSSAVDSLQSGLRRSAGAVKPGDEYLAAILMHTAGTSGSEGKVMSLSARKRKAISFSDQYKKNGANAPVYTIDTTSSPSMFRTVPDIILKDGQRLVSDKIILKSTLLSAIEKTNLGEAEVFYVGGDIPSNLLLSRS